jgi:hypothetical protein
MPLAKLQVIIDFILDNYFGCHQDNLLNESLLKVKGIFTLYFNEYFQMAKHQ